jgi:preprotein translocase subunit Sec63
MTHFDSKINLYEKLGLKEDATYEDIRKAYKKLALKWHPVNLIIRKYIDFNKIFT